MNLVAQKPVYEQFPGRHVLDLVHEQHLYVLPIDDIHGLFDIPQVFRLYVSELFIVEVDIAILDFGMRLKRHAAKNRFAAPPHSYDDLRTGTEQMYLLHWTAGNHRLLHEFQKFPALVFDDLDVVAFRHAYCLLAHIL